MQFTNNLTDNISEEIRRCRLTATETNITDKCVFGRRSEMIGENPIFH